MRNTVEGYAHLVFRPVRGDVGFVVRTGRDWFTPAIRALWYPARCLSRGQATRCSLVPYDWSRFLFLGMNGVRYQMTDPDWTRPVQEDRTPLPCPPEVAACPHEYRAASWWIRDAEGHWLSVL